MAIKGVGVDIVDIARFETKLSSNPGLLERLFAPAERASEADLKIATLAGKFAAKEAFIKAVGSGIGMNWQDVRIVKDANGKPGFELSGATADIAVEAGIARLHLSIAHDGGMAIAYVIAEELSSASPGDSGAQQVESDGGAHA